MVDRHLLRRVLEELEAERLAPLVFGGWAGELLGLEPVRPHKDIDLLVGAEADSVDAFVAERHEVQAKRFSHKRAFVEDGELVELFLVDPATGTTKFWDRLVVEWPSLEPVIVDQFPVASPAALRARVPSVVGIDPHEPSVLQARSHGDDIDYLVDDIRTADLPTIAFDVVAAVAMLHHVDHQQGLRRLAELIAPGGILLVVGLSFARKANDHARDVWDALAIRRHTLTKRQWHTTAPIIWPPPLSYDEVRDLSAEVLPSCEVKRAAYFRYSLVWTAPSS